MPRRASEVGQIGHAQLHRGDLGQAEVVLVERRGDDPKAGHQPVEVYPLTIGAAEEPFEIGSRADGIAVRRGARSAACAARNSPSSLHESPRVRSPPSLNLQT